MAAEPACDYERVRAANIAETKSAKSKTSQRLRRQNQKNCASYLPLVKLKKAEEEIESKNLFSEW